MTIIEKYLKVIEEMEKTIDYPTVTINHCIHNHAGSLKFHLLGYDHFFGLNDEKNLLNGLNSKDIIQIAELFKLGRMDENSKSTHTGYCNVHDDSYIEAFINRRPITPTEKVLYLNALNDIYGSEDRIEATNIMFIKRLSLEETQKELAQLKELNKTKVKASRKTKVKNWHLL